MRYELKVNRSRDGSITVCLPQDVISMFGDTLYLCAGKDCLLRLLRMDQFEEKLERLRTMPLKNVKMLRHVFSFGEERNIHNGLLVIPPTLAEYAKIQSVMS